MIKLIEAPSVLGLRPTGVQDLPNALRGLGLLPEIPEGNITRLAPPSYEHRLDELTKLRNPHGVQIFAATLASELIRAKASFSVVLGGDCSIVLGPLCALRGSGRVGLVYFDAHTSVHTPQSSGSGEIADLDLAAALGKVSLGAGPIAGALPLVLAEDVLLLGYRDLEDALAAGSPDVRSFGVNAYSAADLKARNGTALIEAFAARPELSRVWVHFDVDVISDTEMPAVDYRIEGGLTLGELRPLLSASIAHEKCAGVTLTIYNPQLDSRLQAGANLVETLNQVLHERD